MVRPSKDRNPSQSAPLRAVLCIGSGALDKCVTKRLLMAFPSGLLCTCLEHHRLRRPYPQMWKAFPLCYIVAVDTFLVQYSECSSSAALIAATGLCTTAIATAIRHEVQMHFACTFARVRDSRCGGSGSVQLGIDQWDIDTWGSFMPRYTVPSCFK
jgi:hypothetical protein